MPNKFLLVVAVVLVLAIGGLVIGCGGETPSSDPGATGTPDPGQELTEAEKIEKVIKDRVAERYRSVGVDNIAINENLGAGDGSHIALVRLKFNVKNTVKTGNEMMQMYSDDLVATLAKGPHSVSEVAVFWEDEYNNRSLKCAYEYKDNGFYLTSKAE